VVVNDLDEAPAKETIAPGNGRPRRRLQRRRIQKMSDEQGLLASVTIRKTGNAAAIFSNCASGASLFTGTCGRAPGARRR